MSLLYFWAFWLVYRDPDDDPALSKEERTLIDHALRA